MYLKFRKPGKKSTTSAIDPSGTPFEEVIEEKTHPKMEHKHITIDEAHLEEATKIVVQRVMEKLQPFLDKLAEAVEQQKKETAVAGKENTLADQLTKLQEAATERMAIQEQRVAGKLGKIQARITKAR